MTFERKLRICILIVIMHFKTRFLEFKHFEMHMNTTYTLNLCGVTLIHMWWYNSFITSQIIILMCVKVRVTLCVNSCKQRILIYFNNKMQFIHNSS